MPGIHAWLSVPAEEEPMETGATSCILTLPGEAQAGWGRAMQSGYVQRE